MATRRDRDLPSHPGKLGPTSRLLTRVVEAGLEGGGYYSKTEIDALFAMYYTKAEIDTMLADYYTAAQVDGLLTGYATVASLSSYATLSYVNGRTLTDLTEQTQPLADGDVPAWNATLGRWETGTHTWAAYATISYVDLALADYYTAAYIDAQLGSYYDKLQIDAFLDDIYTGAEVDALLGSYATIASLSSYATQTYVDNKTLTDYTAQAQPLTEGDYIYWSNTNSRWESGPLVTGGTGTVTEVTVGTGLGVATGTTTPVVSLALDALAQKTGALVASDRLVGLTGTTHWGETISAIPLSIFDNDALFGDATQTWVNAQGFLVSADLASYATQTYVDNKTLTDYTFQSQALSDGDYIYWSNGNSRWESGPFPAGGSNALNDLTDVTITTPATGQVVQYNGSGWVNAALDHTDLSDFDSEVNALITTGLSGYATQAWVTSQAYLVSADLSSYATTAYVDGVTLNDILNDAIHSTDDVIQWNGSAWVAGALTGVSLTGHTHLHSDITDFDAEVNTLVDARLDAAQTITGAWTINADWSVAATRTLTITGGISIAGTLRSSTGSRDYAPVIIQSGGTPPTTSVADGMIYLEY